MSLGAGLYEIEAPKSPLQIDKSIGPTSYLALLQYYQGVITGFTTVWYRGLTTSCLKICEWVSQIIGAPLPTRTGIIHTRLTCRAISVVGDTTTTSTPHTSSLASCHGGASGPDPQDSQTALFTRLSWCWPWPPIPTLCFWTATHPLHKRALFWKIKELNIHDLFVGICNLSIYISVSFHYTALLHLYCTTAIVIHRLK